MYSMVTIINNTVLHILMLISKSESLSVMSDSLQPYGLLGPWDSPGKNTRVGHHALLQRTIQPRDRTRISYVFCIGRQVVTTSTTWEAQYGYEKISNINSGKKKRNCFKLFSQNKNLPD